MFSGIKIQHRKFYILVFQPHVPFFDAELHHLGEEIFPRIIHKEMAFLQNDYSNELKIIKISLQIN